MILFILAFFGATFIYAGMLTIGQDLNAGLSLALVGLVLGIKPILRFIRVARMWLATASFGRGFGNETGRRTRDRSKRAKSDKPTYYH